MKKQYKYKLVFRNDIEIDQADNKEDLELIQKQLRLKPFKGKVNNCSYLIIKNEDYGNK